MAPDISAPVEAPARERARTVIETFLRRADKTWDGSPEVQLYGEGLGLDSLEAAELSAMLEDEFGTDPFSAGEEMPETVADVLAFYEVAPAP